MIVEPPRSDSFLTTLECFTFCLEKADAFCYLLLWMLCKIVSNDMFFFRAHSDTVRCFRSGATC